MTRPMSGQEIAEALNISRQAVSNSLKRAMKKCYLHVKKEWPELSPVAISIFLIRWIDMVGEMEFSTNEINKFNRLFPPDIRKEIQDDMRAKNQSIYTIMESVNDLIDCMV